MSAKTINPTTEELLFEIPYMSEKEVEEKIETSNKAFQIWKNMSFEQRGECMKNLVKIMSEKREELAKLNTIEMGMLYLDALWDISKSMQNVMYFVEKSSILLAEKLFEEGWIKGKIVYEPMGILYCVAPWNYPFNQVFRSTIPNLMAWNCVLVKHASNVPQVAIALQNLFLEAGFPEWVYTNLFIPTHFSEKVISHKYVVWTTITGWDKAGRTIWELAWKNLKPSILELGGNDAFVALETKDIDKMISFALSARLSNCWQKCNSSKRFIVLESIYDEFVKKFALWMEKMKVWDPMNTETKIWPLAKKESLEQIENMIAKSVELWAKIATWWKRIQGKGYFFEPTVIYDVVSWMPVFDEEVFGPVASVCKASNLEEAVTIINNSKFWLGCSIFWDNKVDLEYVASKVEVSNVWINKIVTSYAFLPYGWIKNSGYGKELWERWIKTFCNEKVIVMW